MPTRSRCGSRRPTASVPEAVRAIAPIYESRSTQRGCRVSLVDAGGKLLGEIGSVEVTTGPAGEFDLPMLGHVAELEGYIGASARAPDGGVFHLEPDDVAVVVARCGQEAAVTAMLRQHGPLDEPDLRPRRPRGGPTGNGDRGLRRGWAGAAGKGLAVRRALTDLAATAPSPNSA